MEAEWVEGESFVVHLIAGATAGTVEHCGVFPIDTIKVHIIINPHITCLYTLYLCRFHNFI